MRFIKSVLVAKVSYKIAGGFDSKQNDLTPRKAASTLPNVLFHNNGNFGNAMRFQFSLPSTSPRLS